ncbi:MAG: substrate-binding domain-containing protein [Candidatus Omnitrophica bacterium]|nr:substrate-binding domain-containing protein [Candidatus Omnitrophota bacterium]
MKCIALLTAIILFSNASFAGESNTVILATTTSFQDSGLLDKLVPIFKEDAGIVLKSVVVGSGEALALGRRGEADVLLVHSPEDEKKFVEDGCGINRKQVMSNDFILLGPGKDVEALKGKGLTAVLKFIVSSGSVFVSRGDESGTHKKEETLWKKSGVHPSGKSYLETGQGMGETLMVANHKLAYTLADRGTYLAFKNKLDLEIASEGDNSLLNMYSVIEVNPERFPKVNNKGAKTFSDFMVSGKIQGFIKDFGKEEFGKPLFHPEAK